MDVIIIATDGFWFDHPGEVEASLALEMYIKSQLNATVVARSNVTQKWAHTRNFDHVSDKLVQWSVDQKHRIFKELHANEMFASDNKMVYQQDNATVMTFLIGERDS